MDNLRQLKDRLIVAAAQMVNGSWPEVVEIAEGIIEESFNLGRLAKEEDRKEMQRKIDRERGRSINLSRLLRRAAKYVASGKLTGEIKALLNNPEQKQRG